MAKTLSFSVPLGNRQSISLSTALVRAVSFPDAFSKQFDSKPTWKFKAIPLTLSYTYTLPALNPRVAPVVGVGVSYYFSRTKMLDAQGSDIGLLYHREEVPSPLSFYDRMGMGYGAQVTLGLRADLTRTLFVLAQGRCRYVDGLAFTDGNDLRSRFTTIDFSIGIGFNL